MATRIETGLAKLQEASETVEKLKTDLAVMEQDLALASETAEKVHFLSLIRQKRLF